MLLQSYCSSLPSRPRFINTDVLASVLVTLVIYLAYKLFESWFCDYCSPLQHLPGPPSPGYVLGNIQESMMEVRFELRLHVPELSLTRN